MPNESLWRGDVLRLPRNPMLGPGSRPLDLMLYQLWGYEDVLGLLILRGYKAGLPWVYLPPESQGAGRLSLETAWLIANWKDWFCYAHHQDDTGRPVPLPLEGALVIRQAAHAPDLKL